MSSATSQPRLIHLAIAHGVPCSKLAKLLALQHEQAPQFAVRLHEVSAVELTVGLRDGRYDVGMSVLDGTDSELSGQPLWQERLVAVVPARSPLLEQAGLSLDDLLQLTLLRWPAEACAKLEHAMRASAAGRLPSIQEVTSFDLMALLVAAGYGVGIAAESRAAQSQAWGVAARPLTDGPYELVTYLLTRVGCPDPAVEQFALRALRGRAG